MSQNGVIGFNELQRKVDCISSLMLSNNLKEPEEDCFISIFRSFGSVIGVSLLRLVLNNQFRAESKEIVASATKQGMPDNILHMLTSLQSLFDADKLTELVQTVPQNLLDSFHKLLEQSRIALATSMRDVFIIIASVSLVSIILAAFLKEIPLRESNDK
jgi:hypothetical protein